MFWLITDILWYVIYVFLNLNLFLQYWKSLELTGDGKMGVLVSLCYFIITNSIFIIFQQINSLKLLNTEKSKTLYLRRKKVTFLCQNILLFSFDIYFQILRFVNYESHSLKWFFYFVLVAIISTSIYYYIINELGKRLKW